MGRAFRSVVCVGAVVIATIALSSGATAKSSTAHCRSYQGGASGLVDTFTHITALGVSCGRAHQVLGTWANSGPGGTDLGFRCHAKTAKSKNMFNIRCVERNNLITALDTEKAHG